MKDKDVIFWLGGGEFSTVLSDKEIMVLFLEVTLGIHGQTAREIVQFKPIEEKSTDWLQDYGFTVTNKGGEKETIRKVNSNTWRISGVRLIKAEMDAKMMNLLDTHSIK